MRRLLLACALVALSWGLPGPAAAQMVVLTVSLATDGSGDQTVYTRPTFGRVVAVRYVPDATDPMDSTSDLTITDDATGLQLLTITNVGVSARDFLPRSYTVSSTGVNALYAAAGESVMDLSPVAGAIKVVVAQGGASNEGQLFIYVEGR